MKNLVLTSALLVMLAGCSGDQQVSRNPDKEISPPSSTPRVGNHNRSTTSADDTTAGANQARSNNSAGEMPTTKVRPPTQPSKRTSTRPPATDVGNSRRGNPVAEEDVVNRPDRAGDASANRFAPAPLLPAFSGVSGAAGTNVGDLIPEISGNDVEGVPFKLSDYKGKVIMVDFWGDW